MTVAVALVTGSAGLVGSEASRHFAALGLDIVGIDNDMRRHYFGPDSSTAPNVRALVSDLGPAYTHYSVDVRDRDGLRDIFDKYRRELAVVIHTAGQPSHEWATSDPFTDFDVNAVGTLNALEYTRRYSPETPFIFCSSNKVYGDRPNSLPLEERATRWEIPPDHIYANGVREDMPIDACLHSIFGVSKVAADVAVQEYGRYFGMNTATFRCGTLTGPVRFASELHGFLGYLVRTAVEGRTYKINGYLGKQVRDAMHSRDLVGAFEAFFRAPRSGEIYNMGGGRSSNISILEAIALTEAITGRGMATEYQEAHRVGDHLWWISNTDRFQDHYPDWKITSDLHTILTEMCEAHPYK